MWESQYGLLVKIRDVSRISVVSALLGTFLLLKLPSHQINWQIAIAVTALIIGIPHGAVDHLLAIPNLVSLQMAIFLFKYLLVTGLAMWFILLFPLMGFQLIVLCSALHFGVGDASFHMEIYRRAQSVNFPRALYILASGTTPVVIPLVNDNTRQALNAVNPQLIGWAGAFPDQLFTSCVAINIFVVVVLCSRRLFGPACDLLLLLIVATLAPPLVAFAVYFGLWHAVRHTARLTLEFEPSQVQHNMGRPWVSFWLSVRAGLPAVAIVLAFSLWLACMYDTSESGKVLWYLLVVTWALTVPHMALTARSDMRALRRE